MPSPQQAELTAPTAPESRPRFEWLDGAKGLAILWIVFFHFFNTYTNGGLPSPIRPHFFSSFLAGCAHRSMLTLARCDAESAFVGVAYLGFHAVAVFIVASGFGLTYSASRPAGPEGGWSGWYRARVIRLFPMYWGAHLIYLISPFEFRPEPIDYRFFLSLLGDRIYPLDEIFYYANAAWWYFGLILELYLVFPLLFQMLRKLGPGWFLVLCGAETIVSRYVILSLPENSGALLQGAFFGCRLWEFALGMVIGIGLRESRAAVERMVLGGWPLLAALAIYAVGLYTYGSTLTYTVTDALTGTGMFIILANLALWAEAVPRAGWALARVGAYCYGLYLLHQPYVIWLGIRMRWMPMPAFVAASIVIIALITLASIRVERFVDDLTNRVLGRPATAPHPASAA